jgi:xylan 1,4-beta-xylosidase
VDWNIVRGKTTGFNFGLNAYQGFRSQTFNQESYRRNLALMRPGLLRFHNAGALQDSSTPDGLINTNRKTWDAQKIKAALTASVAAFGSNQPQRMINISTWADWMDVDRDGFLDRNQIDAFAQLCADLVKIVNKEARVGVRYWEITNEKDDHYFTHFHRDGGWGGLKDPNQPDRLKELITIYNKAAVAMKKVDPTIQVGGIGLARSDLQPFYIPFIKGTITNLDFFTYHFYATGSAATLDSEIYHATQAIESRTASMINALKAASPKRSIPVMLGEYNISWTWETRDPRMSNDKS